MTRFVVSIALLYPSAGQAQAPRQYLESSRPLATTRVVKLAYKNSFDQSPGEALLELPQKVRGPMPLIVTPHAANWTQEMNRSVWTGVAEQFSVMILYPTHQGKFNPRVSLGSEKQIANLRSAIEAVQKKYSIDTHRIYAAGLSQGALETLLLVGRNPEKFAGAIAINGIPDLIAFHRDTGRPIPHDGPSNEQSLRKLRAGQFPALHKLLDADLAGTPDTARAEYYRRSAVTYASVLARIPLILYWAENDELIPNGATHQGGMLAVLIRSFQPAQFHEVKHSGGHGYPFYQVDLNSLTVKVFPRDIFVGSISLLLTFRQAS